ncbi:hypothetical protein BG011_007433 [Mortierella polycephala]|uniref:Uncharacterized protein n=1 Tax=Mortierella polycephala TaxID=41804 RepID=A0A9P6PQ67_9FUNG|nr:hypothetical protein BG011_007433 [Mortierella polycephala]
MSQNINNTTAANNTNVASRPSIHFSEHDAADVRGRDHSSSTATATIPLTKTLTSESAKSRRSSLAAFADRLRSRSRSRSRSRNNNSGDQDGSPRTSLDNDSDEFKYSRRRSSEFEGDYADVARAQALFMDKLREEQVKNHITHNIDGLPIPPPIAGRDHRRSSVTKILGMEKPLLAR